MQSFLPQIALSCASIANKPHVMPTVDIGLDEASIALDDGPYQVMFPSRKVSMAQCVLPYPSDCFDFDSECDTAAHSSPSSSRRPSREFDVHDEGEKDSEETSDSQCTSRDIVYLADGTAVDVTECVPGQSSSASNTSDKAELKAPWSTSFGATQDEVCSEILTRMQFISFPKQSHRKPVRAFEEGSTANAADDDDSDRHLQAAFEERLAAMNQQLWSAEQTIADRSRQLQEKEERIQDLEAELEQCQMETNDTREAMEAVIASSSNQARKELQELLSQQATKTSVQAEQLKRANVEIEKHAAMIEALRKMLINTCELLKKKEQHSAMRAEQQGSCGALLRNRRVVVEGEEHFIL